MASAVHKRTRAARRAGQRGVSLIEVLVALLVVSFGVLAMGGLLAASLRSSKTSEFRAVATLLASDIADRMRANKPAVALGGYGLQEAYAPPQSPPPDAPPCAVPAACTAAELAAADMAQWKQALFYGLPGAQGYIAADGGVNPPVAADVWVAWLDPAALAADQKASAQASHQECPPAFRVADIDRQPRCLYFRVSL
jgi:type IV pilus assembly protein PilV